MNILHTIYCSLIITLLLYISVTHKNQKQAIYHRNYIIDSLLCDLDDIKQVQKHIIQALDKLPLKKPLKTIKKDGKYGYRRDPFTKKYSFHYGIDLNGGYRDTVYATGDGVVVLAKWNLGYGRCVIIEHEDNFRSLYAHLSRIYVKNGDIVKANQYIGRIGSTGRSTGTHLHYEVIHNGYRIEPCSFIDPLNGDYCE